MYYLDEETQQDFLHLVIAPQVSPVSFSPDVPSELLQLLHGLCRGSKEQPRHSTGREQEEAERQKSRNEFWGRGEGDPQGIITCYSEADLDHVQKGGRPD